MTRRWAYQRVAALLVLGALFGAVQLAFALGPGDSVTFLITVDSNQPEPPSGPSDKVIYTGGRVTNVDISGCGSGVHPVQNAMLIDPDGGRSGRIIGLITASEVEPPHPGTKLKSLTANGSCTIGGTTYNRYLGTVE